MVKKYLTRFNQSIWSGSVVSPHLQCHMEIQGRASLTDCDVGSNNNKNNNKNKIAAEMKKLGKL